MKPRSATNDDSESIKTLIFAVLREFGLAPDPEATDRDLDDIEAYYYNNRGHFAVLEIDNRIVATVAIARVDERTCELRKMYMNADFRGRGIGRQLLDYALATAREMGYSTMVLETATPLVAATALYEKYGFKEYLPDHLSCRCDRAFRLEL